MLLTLLLHLLIFHLLTAKDVPARKDTKYVIQQVETCPNVGYYFTRNLSQNALEPTCHLCFCQGDKTAVCWKRDNRRCNAESFKYVGLKKSYSKDKRIRRSPGLADIFFRDATRDVFSKNGQQECKPYESSFSDDCPPADWCIGCTVCDCDANGHWDCHLLSFCPNGGKGKKKSKSKESGRKIVAKKAAKKANVPTINLPKKTTVNASNKSKAVNKATHKSAAPVKRRNDNMVKKQPPKRIFKKSVPGPQKKRNPIRYQRKSSKSDPKNEMIINKNVATHNPVDIGSSKVNLEMEIAKKVMRTVMANVRQSINGEMKNITKIATRIAGNTNIAKKPASKPKPKPKPKLVKKVKKKQAKKPQRKYSRGYTKLPPKKPLYIPTKKPIMKPTTKEYTRNKRNVLAVSGIESSTAGALENNNESYTTVPPHIDPVTSNLVDLDNHNCSHTPEETSTLVENEYYKYTIGINQSKVITNDTGSEGTTSPVNRTETVFSLIDAQITPTVSNQKNKTNQDEVVKITNNTEINPEANDLKYSKWSHLKIIKDKRLKSPSTKHLNRAILITHINETVVPEAHKNHLHRKNLERKLNSPKYNIVKLLNSPKGVVKRDGGNNYTDIQKNANKTGELQSLLSNILRVFKKNNTTHSSRKNKKFNVLRYLKKFFNKIFKRNKSKTKFSKHHLLNTLCENFGPCEVSKRDKVLLNTKLAELDEETRKILKTVKIIKGLLRLLDLPKKSYNGSIQTDIHKLNNILKDAYAKDGQITLTPTQIIQIEYIKRNTQDFIQSVTKFASLLNEIIVILTKHNRKVSTKRNRVLRSNLLPKNFTKEDPFESLKNMLIRYNLIQNSFMKRIYEQLNNFENKFIKKPKVSEIKDFNNSVAIENFSRNIIQNLRKLKRLAQTASSNGRSKRETMKDDDAIEYLLMLMEYMLKQNHPLDVAPVNDGIDLLIEAIKNAPDIKPIKKKVLEYTSTTNFIYATTPVPEFVTTEIALNDDVSPSYSDKTYVEDKGRCKEDCEDKLNIKMDENKDIEHIYRKKEEENKDTEDNFRNKIDENKELVEMIAESDKESEDRYQYDRKAGIDKVDDITEISFFNRADDNIVLETEYETTTAMPLEMGDKLDNQDDNNEEKQISVDNNNLDTSGAGNSPDDKKYEIFMADIDEDGILPNAITTPVIDLPTSMPTELTTQSKKARTKMRHLTLESFDSESIDKKSKLEWIEENFGRENDKGLTDFDEFNATLYHTVTPKTESTTTDTPKTESENTTDKADASNLTQETVEEADKKNKAKIDAEEVMLKKQMDLLNSLDYGTEKTELNESDSKDSNVDERSDTFPSYFV